MKKSILAASVAAAMGLAGGYFLFGQYPGEPEATG